jgi:soluble lytic murein transglycosylase-like protein
MLVGSLEPVAMSPRPAAEPGVVVDTTTLPPVSPAYRAAAVAVRAHDFPGALQALAKETQRDDVEGRHARIVAGLYAHALELPESAERLLGEEPAKGSSPGPIAAAAPGPLEDWRLWVLADSRAATGEPAQGLAALDRLLADHPDSPLWPRAVMRAVELARDAGQTDRALDLVELGCSRNLPLDLSERIERLGWEIGSASGRSDVAVRAAVRLLTDFPLAAYQVGVNDRFPISRLTTAQMLRRADSLLAAHLPTDAELTLELVPQAERGLAWNLQMARVLTATNRGKDATTLLAPLHPEASSDAALVAWARAQAAFDEAETRRTVVIVKPKGKGKTSRAAARARERAIAHERAVARERARVRAFVELDTAARLGEHDLAVRALHQLFAERAADDDVDAAIAVLHRLQKVAPDDTLGVPYLWNRGWDQYRARNYTGAIGYWSELVDQAPRERYPRGARYWSARAFDALGDHERARALYAELASADTTDFYRRHALARLGDAHEATPAATVPAEPWPSDPRLERARYLSDVGLDGLADTELDLVGDAAEPRARAALEGILLARQGRPRPSMDLLRVAFPALGTPLQASVPPEALELYYPLHYRESVERWAAARDLPVPLVLGVIRQESAFDLSATSHAGARGLMQIMPDTARGVANKLGVPFVSERLYEPDYSVAIGTAYLSEVLSMFDGDVELALAGYNSGPYRLRRLWKEQRHGEVDSFIESLSLEEPKAYVRRILLLSDSYSRLYPELAG